MNNIWVVIPYYNESKYIKDALESVVSQQYKNIIPIVVDDGSNYEEQKYLNHLKQYYERIHIIHKLNEGVSSARNVGIEYVLKHSEENDYIAFLDSDDYWYQLFDNLLIKNISAWGVDIIGFRMLKCDAKKVILAEKVDLDTTICNGGIDSIWTFANQHLGAMLFSVKLIADYCIRFDTNTKYSEDKIFLMQALYLADSIQYINRDLYIYRQVMNSVMHTRVMGIEYYYPILKAYMKSDIYLQQFERDNQTITVGHQLASAYFTEMIKEEILKTGNSDSIFKLLDHDKKIKTLIEGKSEFWPIENAEFKLLNEDTQTYCKKICRTRYRFLLYQRFRKYPLLLKLSYLIGRK